MSLSTRRKATALITLIPIAFLVSEPPAADPGDHPLHMASLTQEMEPQAAQPYPGKDACALLMAQKAGTPRSGLPGSERTAPPVPCAASGPLVLAVANAGFLPPTPGRR